MKTVYVVKDIYYQNLGGYDPDDEWSRDSTSQDVYLRGWSFDRPSADYESVDLEFTPKKSDTLYALCVSYDTGDSFGRDDGQLEVVHLFRDEDDVRVPCVAAGAALVDGTFVDEA